MQPFHIPETLPTDGIAILGTSLTAIDVTRRLVELGYREKITFYSRNSMLPTTMSSNNMEIAINMSLYHFLKLKAQNGKLHADDLVNIVKHELNNFPNNEYETSLNYLNRKKPSLFFNHLLSRSKKCDLPFQNILQSTRPFAYKIWKLLDIQEKIKFNRKYGHIWNTWRFPVPALITEDLIDICRTNGIEYCKLTGKIVKKNGIYLVPSKGTLLKHSMLIDGTGGGANINETTNKLVISLLQQGLILPHPVSGIYIDQNNFNVIEKSGKNSSNFFAIGQLAKGALFSTNAFWFNAKIAHKISQTISSEIKVNTKKQAV